MSAARSLVVYLLMIALRDRLLLIVPALTMSAVGISGFLGGVAIVEQQALSMVYAATASRLIMVVGLVLFVCFTLRRMIATGEAALLMSRPLSRPAFVLAHAAGYTVLALAAALFAALMIGVWTQPDGAGLLQWSLSLWLECIIMVMVALFFSLVLSSVVAAVMACFGFYVLARMIGLLAGFAQISGDEPVLQQLIGSGLEAVSLVIPRLDLFGQTQWLVYGISDQGSASVMIIQTLVYAPLIIAATVFDINRRQF